MTKLPQGWTESHTGGLACNRDPVKGGIIDREHVSKEWFVIFNADHLPTLSGFASREEAFAAFFLHLPSDPSP